MERRSFLEKLISASALGLVFLLASCKKGERIARFGNQERLWKLATGREKIEEPLELAYAKDTPAFFRDSSMGKADPSFKPKIGGG